MYHARYDECDGMSREEYIEYRREIQREKREAEVERKKKMIKQRLMGIGMLLISVLIFVMASHARRIYSVQKSHVLSEFSTDLHPQMESYSFSLQMGIFRYIPR